MNNLLKWIKDNPIRSMFLVPIFLVAGISISHVVAWYDITNPFNWAIYLSIAIEIGAITALIAATQRIKGGVWFMFGLVTFVQMVGNVFYSYKEIDPNGDLFKAWVELMSPIFEIFGTEPTDIIAHKRWLAILSGGLLPIISLTSLHFFVKYEKPVETKKDDKITELFNLEPNHNSENLESEIIENNTVDTEHINKIEEKKEEEIEEFVLTETTTGTTTLPIDDIILNEIEGDLKVKFGEEVKDEEFVNSLPKNVNPKPKKLTYTKSNVSWSKL